MASVTSCFASQRRRRWLKSRAALSQSCIFLLLFVKYKQTMQRFVFLTLDSEARRPQSVSTCKQQNTSLVTSVDIKLKKFRLQERKCVFIYMHDIIKARLGNYPKPIRNKQPHGSNLKNLFSQKLSLLLFLEKLGVGAGDYNSSWNYIA